MDEEGVDCLLWPTNVQRPKWSGQPQQQQRCLWWLQQEASEQTEPFQVALCDSKGRLLSPPPILLLPSWPTPLVATSSAYHFCNEAIISPEGHVCSGWTAGMGWNGGWVCGLCRTGYECSDKVKIIFNERWSSQSKGERTWLSRGVGPVSWICILFCGLLAKINKCVSAWLNVNWWAYEELRTECSSCDREKEREKWVQNLLHVRKKARETREENILHVIVG